MYATFGPIKNCTASILEKEFSDSELINKYDFRTWVLIICTVYIRQRLDKELD